jgi:hypothetical protein
VWFMMRSLATRMRASEAVRGCVSLA